MISDWVAIMSVLATRFLPRSGVGQKLLNFPPKFIFYIWIKRVFSPWKCMNFSMRTWCFSIFPIWVPNFARYDPTPQPLLYEIYYIWLCWGRGQGWAAATVRIIYISTLLNRIEAEKPRQKTESRLVGHSYKICPDLYVVELLHGYFPIFLTDRD